MRDFRCRSNLFYGDPRFIRSFVFWRIYDDDSLWHILVLELHVGRWLFYSLYEKIICYMAGSTSREDEANTVMSLATQVD